jgi:hypothetical protein
MVTLKALMAIGIAALLLVAGWTVFAQTQTPSQTPSAPSAEQATPTESEEDITSEIALTRAAIQLRRQALVTAAMDLEPKEADSFWPLYRDYRVEMAKVNDRFVKLLVSFLENYDTLSDDAATNLLDESLRIDRNRNDVKRKFVPRFSKVIPPRKVARFFQIDNKLDAAINGELARMVPLVR